MSRRVFAEEFDSEQTPTLTTPNKLAKGIIFSSSLVHILLSRISRILVGSMACR